MGAIDELLEQIKRQFISLYDALHFIAEYEKCTLEQSFYLIKAKLLDEQLYLLLQDGFHLVEVSLYDDEYSDNYYYDDNPNAQYVSKSSICKALSKSLFGEPNEFVKEYGFGLRRFIYSCKDLNIDIPPEVEYQAQSPDCYHDYDNPLTEVVKDLQRQVMELEQGHKLAERIATLEQQLKAERAKNNKQADQVQGDSMLILGAVMQCLPEISHNYTQAKLISKIVEKYGNVSGISESTLSKQFSASKKHIEQNK